MDKEFHCKTCDNYNFTWEEVEMRLWRVYYLSWWKTLVWRYFTKNVFPEIVKAQRIHNRLIEARHIAHASFSHAQKKE